MAGISQSKQLWHCTATRKGPAWPCAKPGDVASGLGHLGQHRRARRQQALADGGEAQRPDVLLDQGGAVVAFQRLELVRQGGLGQKQARRRFGQAAALGQRQEGFQMPQFQGRGRHEPVSSFV